MRLLSGLKSWLVRHRWPLGFALATVAARALYLASVIRDPFFVYLRHIPDSFYYNNWAQDIVSTGAWLGGPGVFFIGPLYVYFLAALYAVFGPDLFAVRVAHILLDGVTAAFLFGFTRRTFGAAAAKVTAILWVVYLPAVFLTSFILPVSLSLALFAGGLYFLVRGVRYDDGQLRRGPAWPFGAAGACFGLATLDRPNVVLFLVVAVPLFIWYLKRLGWVRPVLFLVPAVALLGAVSVRNRVVGGDWVFISSQGGINFFIGNSERATGVYWNVGDFGTGRPQELNRDLATGHAEEMLGRKLKPSEVSAWWMGQGLTWIRENPWKAAKLYWDKFRLLTNDYEVPLNVDSYFMKYITPVHGFPVPWFGFVFAFGVVGVAATARRRSYGWIWGAAFLAVYGVSVMAFFVSDRYRIPVALALMPFAGAGVTAVLSAWRRWRWRRASLLTGAAMALGVFSIYPALRIKREASFGQTYYRYGKFYFDNGDYEKAVENLRKSTLRSPENPYAFIVLGLAYQRLGQNDTALATFREGAMRAPDNAIMQHDYGAALVYAGCTPEGITYLARAVELAPQLYQGWVDLAGAYERLGDSGRAEQAYLRALALTAGDADVNVRLAWTLYRNNKWSDAAFYASKAAAINPTLPRAHLLLGIISFQLQDYGTARENLEIEARLDPGNAGVYLLLGAVHYHVGDAAHARDYYRHYLELGGEPDATMEKDIGFIRP